MNGSEMKRLNGHRDSVNDVKFSPNADYLASASQDKTIRLWETSTGACAIVLDDPFGPVQKLCYSPAGSHMISLSSPGNFVSVWNTESNMVDNVLEANNGREIQVKATIPTNIPHQYNFASLLPNHYKSSPSSPPPVLIYYHYHH